MAAGKAVGRPGGIRFQAYGTQGLIDPVPDLCGWQSQVAGAEGDVFLDRHAHHLVVRVLKNHAHAATNFDRKPGIPGVKSINP